MPKKSKSSDSESEWHNVLGSVGQNIYDEYSDLVNGWHERSQVGRKRDDDYGSKKSIVPDRN